MPAQLSMAWMLVTWDNVVPIPGSKNKGRILENHGAAEVELSADELAQLEATLDGITVYGIADLRGKAGQSYRDMQRLVLRGGICHPKVFFDH